MKPGGPLLWKFLAAALLLLGAAVFWAWRRAAQRRRELWTNSAPLRRAAAVILAYPQAAAWTMATAFAAPVPALLLAGAAARLASAAWAGFFFPPVAFLLLNLSLAVGAAGHLVILELAVARLKGAKPGLFDGARAAAERFPSLVKWGLFALKRPRGGARNPFLLPVMIVDRLDAEPAARRAEDFCRSHPGPAQAAAAGYAPVRAAFSAAALVLCPLLIGVASLPLIPLLGFDLRLPQEAYFPYRGLVHALAAVAATALTAGVFASACHKLHSAAIYLAVAAPGEVKAQVFRHFPAGMLLPGTAGPSKEPSADIPPDLPPPVSPMGPSAAPGGREKAPVLPAAGRSVEGPASPYDEWESAPAADPARDTLTPSERERVRREWEEAHALKPARPSRLRLPGFAPGAVFGAFAACAMLAAASLLGAHRLALRQWVLARGAPARATVLEVRSARLIGGAAVAVDFSYARADGRAVTATALVPETAYGALKRGDAVAVRFMSGPPALVELEDDLGHSRQRTALILMVAGLAGVGLYSFLIRRL